jgi:O-antigen/teichoic acid export membrane protein
VLANWSGYVTATAIAFFLSPYIVRQLGDVGYGVWALLVSATGYLGLLDFGVRQAVTRYVARFEATAQHDGASRVLSSACAIFAGSAVVALCASAGIALAIEWFAIPPAYIPAARAVVLLMGATVSVSLMGGAFGGGLAALQRFDLINGIEVSVAASRALAIVAALSAGHGLVMLAWIQLAGSVVTLAANVVLLRWQLPSCRIGRRHVDRAHMRLIASFSAYAFLLHAFNYLIIYADAIVIGLLLPVSQVTFFSIGGSLINYARQLAGGITQTVTPKASHTEATGGAVGVMMLSACRYSSAIVLPVVATFLVRGDRFIGLWMGERYADLSGDVLRVLACALMFSSGATASWAVMFGIGRHKGLVLAYVAEAVCNVTLSAILARTLGIVGVALGTALPSIVMSLVFWPWYVRRILGVPRRTYALHTWVWPTLAAAPFAAAQLVVERWWIPTSVAMFVAQTLALAPIALAGIWFIGMPADDRHRMKAWYGPHVLMRAGG